MLFKLMLWVNTLQSPHRDERGATTTEYVLLAALLSAVVVVAASGLGNKILELVNRVATG